jgi:lipid II:glycine glycyltransferase (peptidoglycan interpeptide bridge formation enzyme)
VPTYDIERVKSLFRHLKRDQILTLQVRYGEQVVATAIFPHDDRRVYGFGFASRKSFQALRPNDLLVWAIMTHSARRGIKQLDLTGKGTFKSKFGSEKVTVYNYLKSYSTLARLGREAYRSYFYAKQKIQGEYARTLRVRDALCLRLTGAYKECQPNREQPHASTTDEEIKG